MKKLLALLMAILLVATFGVFALGSGEEDTDTNQGSSVVDEADNIDDNEKINDRLGDYAIEILSCRLAKNYSDAPIVIVKYKFTNVEDEDPSAFMWSVSDTVYQDGIGLNKAYIVKDSAKYSSDNQSKEIKKGASLEVEVAYELNDTTTDIEVEVQEYLGWSDKKITKTFKIKK